MLVLLSRGAYITLGACSLRPSLVLRVALASMVSKILREAPMREFNAFWHRHPAARHEDIIIRIAEVRDERRADRLHCMLLLPFLDLDRQSITFQVM